jgi:hypothetical protein
MTTNPETTTNPATLHPLVPRLEVQGMTKRFGEVRARAA